MSDKPLAYYDDDGAITIRASAMGKCSRALWASLQEITPMAPTERLDAILSEGHLHERAVREQLESEGAVFSLGPDEQEKIELWIIPGKLKIVGHTDGHIVNWEQGWENKALGKEGFRRWRNVGFDAYPDYPWQISVYMLATGLPFLYTVKCRDDGQLDRMVLIEPPISLKEIQAKAIALYVAHKNGSMPDCDPERYLCSFFFLHDEAKETETFELDDPYFEASAGRLAEVREQIKFLEKVEDDLKGDLNTLAPGIHVAGDYEIVVTPVEQTRLDKEALIQGEGSEIVEKYSKKSTYTTVRIKGRKK